MAVSHSKSKAFLIAGTPAQATGVPTNRSQMTITSPARADLLSVCIYFP